MSDPAVLAIVFASLQPFGDWIAPPGDAPFWLLSPGRVRTPRFDVIANFFAYLPLGAFVALMPRRAAPRRRMLVGVAFGFAMSFAMESLQAPDFEYACVGQDELVPVTAPGAHTQVLEGADAVPVLAYSPESGLGQIMRALMQQVLGQARFKPAITSHHAVLLKTMAIEGRGLAWLPRSLISAELADGRLVLATDDAAWRVPVEIRLFRAAAAQTPLSEAVWARSTAAA